MKKNSIVLSIVLAVVGFFSVLTFAGCDVSVETVGNTIAEVNQQYKNYSSIFGEGDLTANNYHSYYVVNYGDVVNGYVSSSETRYSEFNELENKYNILLALSQRYIDDNSALILNYEKYNKFSGEARKYLNEFNSKLKDFSASFEKFAKERNVMAEYFKNYSGDNAPTERVEQDHLLIFKRAYGPFVSNCVKAAAALAKCIENTEIFDILKATEINENNIKILKEFVEIKTAEALNNYYVEGILNKITWSVYKNKDSQVVSIYNRVENFYKNTFLTNFVGRGDDFKVDMTKEKYREIFNLVDNYLKEVESFVYATNDFDFNKWANTYECKESDYAEKENKLVLVDLDKMEQFIKTTSVAFYNRFIGEIYNQEN